MKLQGLHADLQAVHLIALEELLSLLLNERKTEVVKMLQVVVTGQPESPFSGDALEDEVPNLEQTLKRELSGEHAFEPFHEQNFWLEVDTHEVFVESWVYLAQLNVEDVVRSPFKL